MTSSHGGREWRDGDPPFPATVLADRIAAALVHHEPGWRLPRLTALARRYNVSTAEVDAAIGELTARHLLRRLPDGQVYRASPAECQVPLAGLAGLSADVDPMGGKLTCRSRHVSARRVPEDIGRALGLAPGDTVLVIKCLWLVGEEPSALSATYLPQRLASLALEAGISPLAGPDCPASKAAGNTAGNGAGGNQAAGNDPDGNGQSRGNPTVPGTRPLTAGWHAAGLPRAVQVELGPPPASVSRSLRLAAGEPVAMVTVRFDDPSAGTPVALTMAMLRPDLFRIVVQAWAGGEPGMDVAGFPSAWTQAAEGWEP